MRRPPSPGTRTRRPSTPAGRTWTTSTASRPLYGSCAWAHDMLVPDPAGGAVGDVVHRLIALGVPAGALVIDAGCGTGRYACGLADAGFRVIGVDRSAALLAQAGGAPRAAAASP